MEDDEKKGEGGKTTECVREREREGDGTAAALLEESGEVNAPATPA
eukprot:CAMPEP_0206602708 /NCGR_PEP_ID=MMETSP0325_2-20121206/47648_1 /ASSEMBLY_ACC=CAM_ASM_000347 /TAXON_ID=2866 /ORGANISM="Crypthecodinium cohnii, Strain Seligo" /LENGTH=45 /DNA_ID= /DNA_START= /DNA_END= /DNA_ORIENTATION=